MARALVGLALVAASVGAAPRPPQDDAAKRVATRESLRDLLEREGSRPDVETVFRQSTKQEFNFVGVMTKGLKVTENLEIVISVSSNQTIHFRVYPHVQGGYINVAKARMPLDLMRKLLTMSDSNFLYWGADEEGDVFSGYNFTLESGFPYDAIVMVLRSIRNTDKFVKDLLPFLGDGAAS